MKWLLAAILISLCVGSASAFLLTTLDWTTNFRENHLWIIGFLPLGGLLIGWVYYAYGSDVVKGNNQLLEELHSPKQIIPFKMAPLIFFGTLTTHLFGGSAGREGTAVQMGGAIADQFTRFFKLSDHNRKIILIMGISSGFASVFGTPIAGAVFALEVMAIGKLRHQAFLPSFIVAVLSNYVCQFWSVTHTHYAISFVPKLNVAHLGWTILVGIISGFVALFFSKTTHFFSTFFQNNIKYPPLRPFIGGIVIAVSIWGLGTTKYIGLGIPTIVLSFSHGLPYYDFIIKLFLTAFTLGAGFKGGEVTPLFFIGATLGNALLFFVPLPLALLAGMGFVAVFSGATKTPIACTLMGMELFGFECTIYIGIACFVAYLFSGQTGIYTSQMISNLKPFTFGVRKK